MELGDAVRPVIAELVVEVERDTAGAQVAIVEGQNEARVDLVRHEDASLGAPRRKDTATRARRVAAGANENRARAGFDSANRGVDPPDPPRGAEIEIREAQRRSGEDHIDR